MTRVVATGGARFLGSHLCEQLLDDGCDVIALDNLLTGAAENVRHLLPHPGFRMVSCDVTDYIDIQESVGYVLHFASPAAPSTI